MKRVLIKEFMLQHKQRIADDGFTAALMQNASICCMPIYKKRITYYAVWLPLIAAALGSALLLILYSAGIIALPHYWQMHYIYGINTAMIALCTAVSVILTIGGLMVGNTAIKNPLLNCKRIVNG